MHPRNPQAEEEGVAAEGLQSMQEEVDAAWAAAEDERAMRAAADGEAEALRGQVAQLQATLKKEARRRGIHTPFSCI